MLECLAAVVDVRMWHVAPFLPLESLEGALLGVLYGALRLWRSYAVQWRSCGSVWGSVGTLGTATWLRRD